jgi:hypothetical protein
MAPGESEWQEHRYNQIASQLDEFSKELRGLREKFEDMRANDISNLRTAVALLNLKAAMWATVFGGLSSILVTIAAILLRVIK